MSDFTILRRRPPKHVCVRVGWPLLAEEIVGIGWFYAKKIFRPTGGSQ